MVTTYIVQLITKGELMQRKTHQALLKNPGHGGHSHVPLINLTFVRLLRVRYFPTPLNKDITSGW